MEGEIDKKEKKKHKKKKKKINFSWVEWFLNSYFVIIRIQMMNQECFFLGFLYSKAISQSEKWKNEIKIESSQKKQFLGGMVFEFLFRDNQDPNDYSQFSLICDLR